MARCHVDNPGGSAFSALCEATEEEFPDGIETW